MRRLYVGGLSHTITQKDLKDRFGKFGDVQDVELRTRKDEEGVPYKTFSYINIEISDADLKKCLTVLNKSKWKGGTLQIETAKESFLHRLAQERQEVEEQRLQPPAAEDKRQKLLDSLSKAGVDNFTMKSAVPGTEIPGHKDWVVSKFGRVLPVLQIRSRKGNKARTMKYDPSKFSHNIRKLDQNGTDQPTPVNQLTWEVQGGDDDISKKRRGEFPPYEPPRPKRSRTDVINSLNAVGRSEPTVHSVNHTEPHQFTNGFESQINQRWAQRKRAPFTDSDVDSDEEIRRIVAAQDTSHGASWQEVEEDNLEVVGLDYLVKSGRSQQKGGPGDEDKDDYDSADTDELFASRKPCPSSSKEQRTQSTAEHPPVNNTDRKRKTKKKSKTGREEKVEEEEEEEEEEEDDSVDDEEQLIPPKSKPQKRDSVKPSSERQSNKMAVLPVIKPPTESDTDDDDEEEEESESADSCSDSDYEAMFSNVTCLEISLADLQRLAEESQETSETPSHLNGGPKQDTNHISGPAEQRVPKKGTMPEDILAAIMEDSSDDEKKKKKKKRKGVISTSLPAFQGTKTLSEGSETNQKEEGGSVVKKHNLEPEALQGGRVNQTEEEEEVEEKKREVVAPNKAPVSTEKAESSSSSSDDDDDYDEVEEEDLRMKGGPKATAEIKATISSSSSASEEEDSEEEIISAEGVRKAAALPAPHSESSSSEEEEEEEQQAPSRVTLGAEEEEELQKKANVRRLAAIQQRLKEAEEHKKLIQGALANLDAPTPGKGKHIVFGSDDDDDDDDDDKQQTTSEVTMSKKTLFEDSQSEEEAISDEASANENTRKQKKVPSRPQLFGGSEDEEDGDADEDDSRFDIRPQFEGAAGQKLMALQSRFGTDERFRMDSRFLEEDEDKDKESERKRSVTEEDEALEEEKKKNLSILQSVLGSSQQTCSSKTPSKAKTFRDVSALHYDPSREEHAAFETKTDETKESKSARRKKREEAQKLPEVSKEIYFDVSGDLKAVFGQTKDDDAGGEEKMNWDQEEEEEVTGKEEESTLPSSLVSTDLGAEKESSSGFKFSFFGDDPEPESKETEYKVESIQAPKVSWQQDPRFHDSSEEEEEEEEKEKEQEEDEQQTWQQSNTTAKTTEGETTSKTNLFFFFQPEDSRLTEGPRLFFRSSQLEEQREQWEERRTALRQEYRKKHKDARRKLKPTLKS